MSAVAGDVGPGAGERAHARQRAERRGSAAVASWHRVWATVPTRLRALTAAWTAERYHPCCPSGAAGESATVVTGGGGAGLTAPTVLIVTEEPPLSWTTTRIGIWPDPANVCDPLTANPPGAAVTLPGVVASLPQAIVAVKSVALANGLGSAKVATVPLKGTPATAVTMFPAPVSVASLTVAVVIFEADAPITSAVAATCWIATVTGKLPTRA